MARKQRGTDEALFYVVVCADTQSDGYGGLASPRGWVRPDWDKGGWLMFSSSGLAFQWALNNVGPNKQWSIAPLLQRVVVAAPF